MQAFTLFLASLGIALAFVNHLYIAAVPDQTSRNAGAAVESAKVDQSLADLRADVARHGNSIAAMQLAIASRDGSRLKAMEEKAVVFNDRLAVAENRQMLLATVTNNNLRASKSKAFDDQLYIRSNWTIDRLPPWLELAGAEREKVSAFLRK